MERQEASDAEGPVSAPKGLIPDLLCSSIKPLLAECASHPLRSYDIGQFTIDEDVQVDKSEHNSFRRTLRRQVIDSIPHFCLPS